ncbi:hypothetical protein CDAR_522281 [Caerostris darwini]|uniref:Uncharacterized protein n=1 Tax=Caerostris darwini TaxID=1538125 RepID=A0AAV4SNW1_9ARAC|nr:hypothetical protein CDAR_522281 [Caerostris darwini]
MSFSGVIRDLISCRTSPLSVKITPPRTLIASSFDLLDLSTLLYLILCFRLGFPFFPRDSIYNRVSFMSSHTESVSAMYTVYRLQTTTVEFDDPFRFFLLKGRGVGLMPVPLQGWGVVRVLGEVVSET